MKTINCSVIKMASNGKTTTCQCDKPESLACRSNSPQLGVGGCKPNPRKSRETNAAILPTMAKGANAIIGVSALYGVYMLFKWMYF